MSTCALFRVVPSSNSFGIDVFFPGIFKSFRVLEFYFVIDYQFVLLQQKVKACKLWQETKHGG